MKTGVFGDLREDCEDVEAFSREFPEVVEPDLGFCLREKRPMMEREGDGWRRVGVGRSDGSVRG